MKRKSKTLTDAYKYYKKENPNTKLTLNEYKNICRDYIKTETENAIYHSSIIKLYSRMGTIYIRRIKAERAGNKLMVDYKLSRQYNKKIYHLNSHTDGYYFKWFWKKKNAIFKNKMLYSFIPTRGNKRNLAKAIKEDNVQFVDRL